MPNEITSNKTMFYHESDPGSTLSRRELLCCQWSATLLSGCSNHYRISANFTHQNRSLLILRTVLKIR